MPAFNNLVCLSTTYPATIRTARIGRFIDDKMLKIMKFCTHHDIFPCQKITDEICEKRFPETQAKKIAQEINAYLCLVITLSGERAHSVTLDINTTEPFIELSKVCSPALAANLIAISPVTSIDNFSKYVLAAACSAIHRSPNNCVIPQRIITYINEHGPMFSQERFLDATADTLSFLDYASHCLGKADLALLPPRRRDSLLAALRMLFDANGRYQLLTPQPAGQENISVNTFGLKLHAFHEDLVALGHDVSHPREVMDKQAFKALMEKFELSFNTKALLAAYAINAHCPNADIIWEVDMCVLRDSGLACPAVFFHPDDGVLVHYGRSGADVLIAPETCEERATACCSCDDLYLTTDLIQRIGTDDLLCHECACNDDLRECEHCGHCGNREDAEESCLESESVCPLRGMREYGANSSGMFQYSTNVLAVLPKPHLLVKEGEETDNPRDTVFYGVELECVASCEIKEATALIYKHLPKFVICKYDGSLPSNGLEIVTLPATLAAHKEKWNRFFEEKVNRKLSSWTHSCCGMHVHISRKPLSALTVGKLIEFINSDKNLPFLTTIAGRPPNEYCTVNANRKMRASTGGQPIRTLIRLSEDHHNALTVSRRNNATTLELRMFKGNVAKRGFFKNLEFVDALVSYARFGSSLSSLATIEFLGYVNMSKGRWPYLSDWLQKHGYLPSMKKEIGSGHPKAVEWAEKVRQEETA